MELQRDTTEWFQFHSWRIILGLTDWTFSVYVDCGMAETEGNTALTEWDEIHKCAVIHVISEKEYGERMLPFDFERTIIHELLHVKLSLLQGRDDLEDRLIHQLIEEFAKILVEVERDPNSPGNLKKKRRKK